MHVRDTIDELGARQYHGGTAENVAGEIQENEYKMSNLAVPHSNDLKRSVGIRNPYLGHHT